MSKITYTDKVALNINQDVADVNKCNATDLNEIKQVVNENDDNVGDLTQLETPDKSSIVNAINSVVESGNVGTKKYIKYADGTMICSNTIFYSNISITTTWGSFYESSSLSLGGDYPVPFIAEPDLIVSPHYPNFIEKYGDASSTNPGTFYATKPRSSTGETVKVSYIAIGRWK